MTAYYVQPEPSASGGEAYWLEGYAVGDAKFAAAQSDGTSTTLIASSRVKETGLRSDGTSTSLFGGNRVVAGALVQEPVTATVTGVTRVRQGSIRADGTSTTLIGGNRVRPIGVLSEGIATTLAGGNATYDAFALTRDLYVEGGYWNTGYTEYSAPKTKVIVQPIVLKFAGVSSSAASSMLTSAGSIRGSAGILSEGQASTIASGSMTYSSLVISAATSTALGALSRKWTRFEPVDETWTDASDVSELWTEIDDTTETWTTQ